MYNPCVPVDYPTVNAAFAIVRGPRAEQTRSIRVLLRPGRYVLQEAITVQAPESVQVEVVTMQMPASFVPIDQITSFVDLDPIRKPKSSPRRRNFLTCQSIEAAVDPEDEDMGQVEAFEPSMLHSPRVPQMTFGHQRATLVLRTRRPNEPILRVRQGNANLRNLELHHVSPGVGTYHIRDESITLSMYHSKSSLISICVPFSSFKIFGMEMPPFRFSHRTERTSDRSRSSPPPA